MAEADSTASTVNNGVNVAALISAREALTNAPQAAQFKWRAACEWKNGTHSHSTVEGYYGLGQEQHHKRTFTFDADHPEVFASEDHGATPVEYVLVGLASCLTAGIAAVAQHRIEHRYGMHEGSGELHREWSNISSEEIEDINQLCKHIREIEAELYRLELMLAAPLKATRSSACLCKSWLPMDLT